MVSCGIPPDNGDRGTHCAGASIRPAWNGMGPGPDIADGCFLRHILQLCAHVKGFGSLWEPRKEAYTVSRASSRYSRFILLPPFFFSFVHPFVDQEVFVEVLHDEISPFLKDLDGCIISWWRYKRRLTLVLASGRFYLRGIASRSVIQFCFFSVKLLFE
jgi:hypothetical protein